MPWMCIGGALEELGALRGTSRGLRGAWEAPYRCLGGLLGTKGEP